MPTSKTLLKMIIIQFLMRLSIILVTVGGVYGNAQWAILPTIGRTVCIRRQPLMNSRHAEYSVGLCQRERDSNLRWCLQEQGFTAVHRLIDILMLVIKSRFQYYFLPSICHAKSKTLSHLFFIQYSDRLQYDAEWACMILPKACADVWISVCIIFARWAGWP